MAILPYEVMWQCNKCGVRTVQDLRNHDGPIKCMGCGDSDPMPEITFISNEYNSYRGHNLVYEIKMPDGHKWRYSWGEMIAIKGG